MATDVVEAPSPTSQPLSYISQRHHFYLVVDRCQFKMDTLVDLLGTAAVLACQWWCVTARETNSMWLGCLWAKSSVLANKPDIFLFETTTPPLQGTQKQKERLRDTKVYHTN
ncbi:hypothetical protein F0562_017942 [Nyssa sinensis]|uniref:Uncharacterized protein n=1 Tax=Nyssa sinensis TaxID=561372 RepID=A0A5J4Z7X2_9ASTE|nr:hypothetical protein F0562_017942 [Nyssa sinensis]